MTSDLDAYLATIDRWTPEAVEAATDVPAETVVRIGREFGRARPAVVRAGVGFQQTVGGESAFRALSALAILGGHWQLPGGGFYNEASPDLDERAAARPDLLPGVTRSLDLARIGEHLTSVTLEPRVLALVVWGMNPVATQPDADVVRRGLEREDLFTVVLEHFMTDTARYADIILPSTTQLEHFDIVGSWGHQYISANEPAIAPLGASLSHGEIARRLAGHLGLHQPALFESDEAIAASALPTGVTLDLVRAQGWLKRPPAATPFGPGARRVHIAAEVGAPLRPSGSWLQLLTPKSHYFLNTTFGNMPRQRAAMKRPTLDMHPVDATARGLIEGDDVDVGNERGALRVALRITDTIHQGVVALPGKWWSTPAETSAVANRLSPSAWTPHGQPAYNDTFVEVVRSGTERFVP